MKSDAGLISGTGLIMGGGDVSSRASRWRVDVIYCTLYWKGLMSCARLISGAVLMSGAGLMSRAGLMLQ